MRNLHEQLVRPKQQLGSVGCLGKEVSGALGIEDEKSDEQKDENEGPEEQEVQQDEEPGEALEPIRKRVCPLPSPEEQRRHRVTHLPFRSWRPQCVAGAANDDPHRRALPDSVHLDVPEVHWDYCFPRDQEEWNVVLVGRDRETNMTLAHVVPCKGAGVEWLGEQLGRDLVRLGIHDKVILKSDQEPAIVDVLNELAKRKRSRTDDLGAGPGV